MPVKSQKQKKFMQAVEHNKDFAEKVGVKQSVATEMLHPNLGKALAKRKRKKGVSVMSEYLQAKIDRLDEKLDEVCVSVAKMQEQQKMTYDLLVLHDAKGAKALEKAKELEHRMDTQEAVKKAPLQFAITAGKIATAIAAIYGVFKLLWN